MFVNLVGNDELSANVMATLHIDSTIGEAVVREVDSHLEEEEDTTRQVSVSGLDNKMDPKLGGKMNATLEEGQEGALLDGVDNQGSKNYDGVPRVEEIDRETGKLTS